jgi:hypothetical protein
MSLPVITRAELKALRTRLEFGPTLMAERIGLSLSHYLAIEDGTAPINLLINNAVRWLDHVKGAAPSDVCGSCDGRGTIRPDTPGQRQGNIRARVPCEACEGEGVKRALVAA